MDVSNLRNKIEFLSEQVHNAWWDEKKRQGFHAPIEHDATPLDQTVIVNLFEKKCDKCHTDMYPYKMLPENIKDYDRVMVKTVLDAIEKL